MQISCHVVSNVIRSSYLMDKIKIHWFPVTMSWEVWHTIPVVDTDNISRKVVIAQDSWTHHMIWNDNDASQTKQIWLAKAGLNLTNKKREQVRKMKKCGSLSQTNYRWRPFEPSPLCKFLLCCEIWQKVFLRQNLVAKIGTNLAESVWQMILCRQAGSQRGRTGLALQKSSITSG